MLFLIEEYATFDQFDISMVFLSLILYPNFISSGSNGQRKALIWIDGAHSTDWEDIACGPCAGGSGNCVYIADTGGNAGGDANTIYRIREPDHLNGDMHVSIDSTLQFR